MPGRNTPSFQRVPTEGLLRAVPASSIEMSHEVNTEPPHQVPNYGSDSPNDCQQDFPVEPNAELPSIQDSKRRSDVSVVTCVPTWRRAIEAVLMARLEIFLALHFVARKMSSTAVQELLIQKSCLNDLALNASVCSHLDDFEEFKDMAEKAASMTSMMRSVVLLTPSAVIAIFIGPWCDKYGYRTPLVTATLGFLASTLLDVITVYNMGMAPYVNILTVIPDGLCGGLICVITAVCSEATLLTKEKRRRVRFFAISVTMSLSVPLGSYVGGLVYGHFGWEAVLYASFAIAALGLVWAFVAIRNLVKPDHAQDGLSLRFRNFFHLQNLTESVKSAMKPRPNRGRLQLWCLFGAICCVMFDLASTGIAYFYVRKMYSWSVSHYSTVQSVSAVVGVVLNTPTIFLFVKVFKISDPAMALVGICFATAQVVILGFAYEEWLYYLQCLVGLPAFVGQVGIRTHLSKLVGADEVGKIFSLLASFESVVPIAGEVLLTTIFNWSIGFLPGLPYLVIASITSIAIVLTAFVTKVHRYSIKYQDMSKTEVSSGPIND